MLSRVARWQPLPDLWGRPGQASHSGLRGDRARGADLWRCSAAVSRASTSRCRCCRREYTQLHTAAAASCTQRGGHAKAGQSDEVGAAMSGQRQAGRGHADTGQGTQATPGGLPHQQGVLQRGWMAPHRIVGVQGQCGEACSSQALVEVPAAALDVAAVRKLVLSAHTQCTTMGLHLWEGMPSIGLPWIQIARGRGPEGPITRQELV